ncbi:integrase [Streptomyces sp. NPDC046371]|uniref:integrase n=1 Tax=Streptomyces sp. NPDC046371 TaxID=3154916 RepID=UPI00340591B6
MNGDEEVVDAEVVSDLVPVVRHVPRSSAEAAEEPDPDAWLPPEAEEDVQAGIPESTERAYGGDMLRFAEWCASVGRRPMPAASETVTAYMSYLKRTPREQTKETYSPRSMDRVIASIRSSHRAAGLNPPDTMGARKVVRGYRAALSEANDPRALPRKASPADREVLREALQKLDRSTLAGKRDAALMLLGHAVMSRGSELVPLDWPTSFTPDPDPAGGFTARVYRKKRKRWQDVEVPLDPDPDLCAVRAVHALARAMEFQLPPQADVGHVFALFQRIDRHGYLAPEMTRDGKPIGDPSGRMTAEAASDIVERSIRRTGRDGNWTSHALRRGGVKSARRAGADIVDIGRHGGWDDRSKSLIGYIDEDDSRGDRNPLVKIGKHAVAEQEERVESEGSA